MRSVRRYLMSRMLAGATLVLAFAGAVVYAAVAHSLDLQFDANLADRVRGLASTLFQTEDEVSFEFSDELMPEYAAAERPAYFELRFEDGTPLESSNSLGEGRLEVPHELGAEALFWSADLPDGRSGRFAGQLAEIHHVFPEEGPNRPQAATVALVVGLGRESLRSTQRVVLLQIIAAFAVLTTLLVLITRRAVRHGLEPTHRLALALDGVSMDHLPERFDVGALPEELEPMARKADALIRRAAEALERERRTTADIAHELRTPISEVLTVSEVALRGNGNGSLSQEGAAFQTIRDIASHMGRSVSTLLKLAWLESGGDSFQKAGVDLGAMVQDLLAGLSGQSRERGLSVLGAPARGVLVEADPDVLRIIVANLLSNALTYAPRDSEVTFEFDAAGANWRLALENDAADLTPADLSVLADPFWRKDPARAERHRFGLGLALSSALAQKTDLRLVFSLHGRRLRAVLGNARPSPAANGHAANGASATRSPESRQKDARSRTARGEGEA